MLTRETFITQLSKLVSFESVTHNVEANAQALNYVESLLSQHAHVTRIENGNAQILLASTKKTKTPDYGYLVHIDVVAGETALFSLKQKDGKVFGRGVSDMKFSIPLGVALLNELLNNAHKIKKIPSFTIAITTDEETGGFHGAQYLAETYKWRPKVLLVPDGGDNFQFVEASKGAARFAVTAKGIATHASRPWEGKNALSQLIPLCQKLQKIYPTPTKPTWKTTLNIGQLHGGISTNQVCDHAVLELDYRFPETDSVERITTELKEVAHACDPTLQVELLMSGLPTATDTQLPEVTRFIATIEKAAATTVSITKTYGASDARYFAPYSIPVLMSKPIGGGIHSQDEWLDIDSTLTFYHGLRAFLFET